MSTSRRPTTSTKSADSRPSAPRRIELLAPAKDKHCGVEAILHGADAVYIGAELFSARAAAGNSLADIAELTAFAHFYRAKVYVALNTLLTDAELPQACALAFELARAGADALIVQDMGLVYSLMQYTLDLPGHRFPLPLHASTQMDNRTAGKAAFLQACGMEQVVLARELSLEEIGAIHRQCPTLRLEAFVHGALCVSYSGQCYISQYLFKRSANKGRCAQACRLTYDLIDARGEAIARNRALLSLKDLNQSDRLEALLEAGVTSLKIEGRLKDASYVKNLTAFYRRKLDALIASRPERYARASSGLTAISFRPDPYKSFNRGFTHYFLDHTEKPLRKAEKQAGEPAKSPALPALSAAPVSQGEPMGRMTAARPGYIEVAPLSADCTFHNGDGLLVRKGDRQLGLLVNRAEGTRLYYNPKATDAPLLKTMAGGLVFRNRDSEFEHTLSRPTATRKIRIGICLRETGFGFSLELEDEDGISVSLAFADPKEKARSPQEERTRSALCRLGDTPFSCAEEDVRIDTSASYFLPAARLNEWRRAAVESLRRARLLDYRVGSSVCPDRLPPCPEQELSYRGNVLNREAAAFYRACGVRSIQPAYEARPPRDAALMHTRYCIRRELGICRKEPQQGAKKWAEPLYLQRGTERFPLRFDCARCEMYVLTPEN